MSVKRLKAFQQRLQRLDLFLHLPHALLLRCWRYTVCIEEAEVKTVITAGSTLTFCTMSQSSGAQLSLGKRKEEEKNETGYGQGLKAVHHPCAYEQSSLVSCEIDRFSFKIPTKYCRLE